MSGQVGTVLLGAILSEGKGGDALDAVLQHFIRVRQTGCGNTWVVECLRNRDGDIAVSVFTTPRLSVATSVADDIRQTVRAIIAELGVCHDVD